MNKPIISAIAAVGKNRELGNKGKLPWHVPEDLKHFKETTLGHPIIMGRKTFESLGIRKPLPNRTNIVVTRNPDYRAEGAIVVQSIEDAIEEAKKHETEEIFVIGGEEIFKLAWPHLDRLNLTVIDGEFEADAFFPEYEEFGTVVSRKELQSGEYRVSFLVLEKQ
ncbi:MAG: dihydrofolate reductase [Patescibacteria group bacterium]|nr:dihydrofolate reductase [bacterium]MDZ4221567.1 dihydrofolate reductase [Patescibacteria group bacterium]